MSELLTPELLDRLDRTLRGLGAAIVDRWESGLTREQMDALTEPHGFRLPEEAALWWGWHNGAAPGCELTPDREPLRLGDVMQGFELEQGAMSDAFGLTGLVGVVTEQPWLWFDCRVAPDAPVPVYAGYKSGQPRVVAESIGDMVLALIAALETGHFTTDQRGEWNEIDWDTVPDTISESGIV
jgi:hypothetical protein